MCPEEIENRQSPANNGEKSTLLLVAFILMLITTITTGFLLIPLAWCIPMTVSCYKCYNENRKASIGFGVCTLIFVNLVSGILMLVDTSVEK